MFENLMRFFRKMTKKENKNANSKEQAKERLHLVLMQDRANVSADFLDLMRQEIIDVIKKYIEVDENAIDVRLTNKDNGDGTTGAPALYANIPITKIKEDLKKPIVEGNIESQKEESKKEKNNEGEKEEKKSENKLDEKKEDSLKLVKEKKKNQNNVKNEETEQKENENDEKQKNQENIENSNIEANAN